LFFVSRSLFYFLLFTWGEGFGRLDVLRKFMEQRDEMVL
jgi:hypothetical protein